MVSGLLCLVLAPLTALVHFQLRGGGTGHGLGDAILFLVLANGIHFLMAVSALGAAFNLVATLRHETGECLALSRALNLGPLLATALIYLLAFYLPQSRAREQIERERKRHLASRSLEELLIGTIWEDRPGEARELLRLGADPNGQDRTGQSVLNIAIAQGSGDMLKLLLAQGAVADPQAPTELHAAAWHFRPDMVETLVEHGWDANLELDYLKEGKPISPLDCARSRAAVGSSDAENKQVVIDYLVRVTKGEVPPPR